MYGIVNYYIHKLCCLVSKIIANKNLSDHEVYVLVIYRRFLNSITG